MGKRSREDPAVSPAKKHKKEKSRSNGAPAAAVDSVTEVAEEREETKEERRARKAAKAARKAEKLAARQSAEDDVQEDTQPEEAVEMTAETPKKSKKDKKEKSRSGSVAAVAGTGAASTGEDSTRGYTEHAKLTALPQQEIDAYMEKQTVHVETPQKLRPIVEFQYLPTMDSVNSDLWKGFKAPTSIQAVAWPYLLSGRDAVGVAQTGSGKTLAFGLPCIRHVARHLGSNKSRRGELKAVVVSPTRELAQQIHEQFQKLTTSDVRVVCLFGGVPKDAQRAELARAQIIIATPGRLQDFIQEGAADLSTVDFLVLDEADRMLEKGFKEEMRKIIGHTQQHDRQTLMFTATWPPTVRSLAESYMRSPVKITIGDNPTGELRANARIKQVVEVVDQRAKERRLLELLRQHQSGKQKNDRILVFCLYKKEAARVEGYIRSQGFRVAGIHGDMNQTQRMQSLEAFKSGSTPLLVATDVAARGLDIPAVKLVINCTFPLTVEDYVHRIGRTGRAGADGLAITLFTELDKAQSGALINVLKAASQPVPPELLKFGTTVKKKEHASYGAFYKDTTDMPAATRITFD